MDQHDDGSQPLRRHEHHRDLHVPRHWRTHGSRRPAGSWLNATHLDMVDDDAGTKFSWQSRSHRKNRYPHVWHLDGAKVKRPRYRLWGFDCDNISWWIAQLFLWGSVAWVINGWFLFLPTDHEKLNFYMAGYSALVGGTLFWIGAYLSVVEAVNVDDKINLPKEVLHSARHDIEAVRGGAKHLANGTPPTANGQFSSTLGEPGSSDYQHSSSSDQHSASLAQPGSNGADSAAAPKSAALEVEDGGVGSQRRKWRWWGWRWHDLGYIAVFVQFVGATLFSISTIVGIPNVLPDDSGSDMWRWDVGYWALQTIGAWGFIISAGIFMVETQRRWWLPAPLKIGWHVGWFNLLGALGFELSAVFGFTPSKYERYGVDFSTFWGAWAFLIGSYFQLLEALNKHPTNLGEDKTA